MFWTVASGQSTGPEYESLLSKENVTLDEILSTPYIVQEVTSSNKDAVRVLTKEDILDALIGKITTPSEADDNTGSEHRLVACEIICSECLEIAEAICARPSCLHSLFQAFHNVAEKDSQDNLRSVARVIGHIFAYDPQKLLEFLKANKELLERLVLSAEYLDVAETLTRLLGADDEAPSALRLDHLKWIKDTNILNELLNQMEQGDSLRAEYAAEILAAIARAKICPFTQELSSVKNLERILSYASSNSQSAKFIRALNICISLVERRRVWENAARDKEVSSQNSDEMPNPQEEQSLEVRMVSTVTPRVTDFMQQLAAEQSTRVQETPYGILKPPLGSGRLTIMALISVLLRTSVPAAEEILMEAGILQTCLDLFHDYPFNSILHQQVTVIIAGMLDVGSDALVSHVFTECKLLDWLINLPTQIVVTPNPKLKNTRTQQLQAGYTGHMTHIANRLLHAAAERSHVWSLMESHTDWQDYVASSLEAANERQDVAAWECGRPKESLESIESVGHDPLDDEIAASMNNRGSRFGLPFTSAFSADDSDDEKDGSDAATLLFEDAEPWQSSMEEGGKPPSGEWSRFKIRQLLPSAVDDWEDLADADDVKTTTSEKLTPRPDGKSEATHRRYPPLSPFSSADLGPDTKSVSKQDGDDQIPGDEVDVKVPESPWTSPRAIPGERLMELESVAGSSSVLGPGSWEEVLQSSTRMDEYCQPGARNVPTSPGSSNPSSPLPPSPSRKHRKSDKESKLEKMQKDDNDEMMDEINAGLAEVIDADLDIEDDVNAKNKYARKAMTNGSDSKANLHSGENANSSHPQSWLEADNLKDVKKAKSAILLP